MSDSDYGDSKNHNNNSARSSGERSRSATPHSRHSSAERRRSYSKSRSRSGSRNHRSRSRSYRRSRSASPRRRSRSYERRSRSYSPRYSPRRRSRSRSRRSHSGHRSRSRSPMSDRKRHVGDRMNPPMGRCLGVFGLSLYTTENDLRDVFARYGRLDKVNVVIDQKTGRSRGFGFVYFENKGEAEEAKERANGMELDGRRIRVDFSITKRAHTPTPGVYVGRPTGPPRGGRTYDRYGDRDRDRYNRRDDYRRDDYRRDDYRGRDYGRRSPSPYYRRRSPSPYRDRSPYRSRY